MEQARVAEVIGADKAIAIAAEYSNSRTHAKGRADAGDGVLLSQETDVVRALKKDFDKIGAAATASGKKAFQPGTPGGVKTTGGVR
jgi:hypothetical protein